jgi:PHD/YefM family antitoxin component YafN of YafNO toxin-antitoxin module
LKQSNRTIRATFSAMQTFSANKANTQFWHFIDIAQREPVRVTRRDRVVGVMVSAQDYEAMRAFYANRLQHTLVHTAAQAQAAGLSPEALQDLLRDESSIGD